MVDWTEFRLDELADIVTGATPKASEVDSWGTEVDFVTPTDQTGQRDVVPERRLSQIGIDRLRRRLVPPGSTALTCIGSTIGKVSLNARPTVTNQQINTLVGRPGVCDPAFLYYLIRWWSPSLQTFASGSATPIVNKSVLGRFSFKVPDLASQRAIGEMMGALDNKIAANLHTAKLASELAMTTYHAFRPSADNLARLADLVESQYGVTTSAKNVPGPRLLRVTDINKQPWIEWHSAPGCELGQGDLEKYQLTPGDIIVARMADPGKAAMIDEGDPLAVFASYLVRLSPTDSEQAEYIYYFLRSPEYVSYADRVSSGSVQRNMNAKLMVGADIVMPSHNNLAQFNALVRPLRRTIRALLRESSELAATLDELLSLLMSGKVHVRDAEETLERIV